MAGAGRLLLAMFPVNHHRPLVMGILNITPDSFSDGGQLYKRGRPDLDKILFLAESLVTEGADILDVGGESTRPGAQFVTETEELERVIPVIAALRSRMEIPLSVDTSNPELIRLAAAEGAAMINDVRALCRPGALEAAAASQLPVALMHMRGEPKNMQANPTYQYVLKDVFEFLMSRVNACELAGIDRSKLIIDPGFGFGKTIEHNLELLRGLPELVAVGLPVLVGLSRKRMIGDILDKPTANRVYGSISLALLAAQKGASMIRVHDVEGTVDALKILAAVERS